MSLSLKPKLRLSANFKSPRPCPSESLKLSISSLGGHVCTVLPDCRSTIADVKTLIEKSADIPAREQRLVLRCSELRDSEMLQTCLQGSLSIVLLRRDPETASWIEGAAMGWDLAVAPDDIRNDQEVVHAAVKRNGMQFAFASDDLRDDRDTAMLAILSSGGRVFKFCSERLRRDRDLLQFALDPYPGAYASDALMHASDDLRNDKVFVLEVVERNVFLLRQVPSNLQHDKDVILAALAGRYKQEWRASLCGCAMCVGIGFFPPHLLRDKHFIATAVDLGQVGFLERAFCQHPELCEDRHLLRHLFSSMLQSVDFEHPVFDARWLRGPMKSEMKSHWNRMVASYRAEENLRDKSALELRRERARMEQYRKRARKEQQKARVRQPRSNTISLRGGRHKTTYVEDWFL